MKCFYTKEVAVPKVHINDTNVPFHLEEMLQILIAEETNRTASEKSDCMEFILGNRPLDLLSELSVTDSPPGATICILSWVRRFLTCVPNPRLDQEGIFQPIQVNLKIIGDLIVL